MIAVVHNRTWVADRCDQNDPVYARANDCARVAGRDCAPGPGISDITVMIAMALSVARPRLDGKGLS